LGATNAALGCNQSGDPELIPQVQHHARRIMDLPPRAKRSSVFMDAILDFGDPFAAPRVARIRDISEGGAKIQGRAPDIGARVVISRGATDIPGRVVWTADHHFGVAFDEQIDVEAVLKAAPPKAPDKPVYAAALTSGLAQVRRNGPRARPLFQSDRASFGLRPAPGR
jgi:hypothetical protein